MKIVENNTKSWEDNDTHSNGKDKRKRARVTTVRTETAFWTREQQAVESLWEGLVQKQSQVSFFSENENLDWLADRTYNRILWNTLFKVFVSTVKRVHTVHRHVRGNTTVMRPSITTWEKLSHLDKIIWSISGSGVTWIYKTWRARMWVRAWVHSRWKYIVVIVFLITPSPFLIVWWLYLVVNQLL